jgi:protocatechuate 3,4-dioxygenase beta subunit
MSSDSNDKSKQEARPSTRDGLRLNPDVQPTKSLLTNKEWIKEIKERRKERPIKHEEFLGPFYRERAPYRAKLSLPYEEGEVLVIKGHVWSHDDKSPLAATMDVWQADSNGLYDNEEEAGPATEEVFINRVRLRCDEDGYYEFETVLPGAYKRGGIQHAAHIHFSVMYSNYVTCVTQLLFSNDKHLIEERYREWSVVIDLVEMERNGQKYKEGVFDIVLAPKA